MAFVPQATIDHRALRHNLQRVRETAPESRVWAVIKANAYGHGMERVAATLQAADGFAVARIEEAQRLRHAGVTKPILILEGVFTAGDVESASENGFQLTVHHLQQVELLETTQINSPVECWLKVDTGMHRLGFVPSQLSEAALRLQKVNGVGDLHLMTHLANADDRNDPASLKQCERFDRLTLSSYTDLSIANSAGLLAFDETHRDWVRPGIMLYGVSPFQHSIGSDEGLQPVMTFSSRVLTLNHCNAGDRVGYGGTFECPESMPVAVIGVGYGDGYPRHAKPGTPVLIRNQRLPLIGRVSMDMICVDARALPDLQIGEEVVLWGAGLPVELIAQSSETIAYELLCGITGRVDFIDVEKD